MQVTIYGTKICQNCDRVKTYLTTKEIPFSYSGVGVDITKEELEQVVHRSVRAVPVIVVDGDEKTFEQLRHLTQIGEPNISLQEARL